MTLKMKNRTENMMIAADMRQAGFGVEVMEAYSAIRVYLTRKVSAMPWQVRTAMERAGYEDCQYRLTDACGSVYLRAVVA